MVPLEDKMNYLSRINDNPKLKAFNNLLSGKDVQMPPNDLDESEEIYFGIVTAIQIGNKIDFEKHYHKKSKSKPNKDSPAPFVHDDFLIFAIMTGVVKFNIDKSWIRYILSIRNRNQITITFENILNENFYSTSNTPEIVFMFLQLENQALIINDFVKFTFEKIIGNVSLFESRSDLLIMCSLNAYNFIILSKETPDTSELTMLKNFNEKFIKRMTYLSWVLQSLLFGGLIYLLLKLPNYSPKTVALIEKYNYAFTIFGILGLTILGNAIPILRDKSKVLVMKMFGYPKYLIIELKKKKNK